MINVSRQLKTNVESISIFSNIFNLYSLIVAFKPQEILAPTKPWGNGTSINLIE